MRMPAQSLLPLLGETGCGYPDPVAQERAVALGVLRQALSRACAGLPAPGVQWEVEVLQVRQDWRRVWHPLPHRRALCRVRQSARMPFTELIFHYAYPEGCSVEDAVAGSRVREGADMLAALLAKAQATAEG